MVEISNIHLSNLSPIKPKIFNDNRGYFFEYYKSSKFKKWGLPKFVQDNVSVSKKNVIRGLHFQHTPHSQGKLVIVLKGKIFDVAVDIRPGSETFGNHVSFILDSEEHKCFYIPEGFAHGFCSLADDTIVLYKNTSEYNPSSEGGIIWNDPDLAIEWPSSNPIISPKDSSFKRLNQIF